MTTTCTSFIDWYEPSGFCDEPAIGTVFAACEHEHVNEQPVCAACAAELQRDSEGWMCAHCDHECLFRCEIRFDGGEVAVLSPATGGQP